MTPYYQDDLVTLYHGDAREWMPDGLVEIEERYCEIAANRCRQEVLALA